MSGLELVDLVALGILGLAALRGLLRGLVREAFSIGGIAAAVIAVRVWNPSFAPWVARTSDGQIGDAVAPWIGGALLAVGAIVLVAVLGALARRGARAAGLGLVDRAGGAAVGLVEGALVAAVALTLLATLLGRDHAMLAGSRTLAMLERFEAARAGPGSEPALDVAAPPRR